jgi:hypothetical protein
MIHGPQPIVTNGLVLALDAANLRSYVTGSTISNLNLYSQNSLNDLIFDGGDTATTGSLAPDSTNTAVLLKENTSLAQHRFYAGTSTTLSSNTLYTYSIYAKSAGRTKGLWYAEWANGRIGINYDLGTGTISNYQTGTNTLYTSSISSSGNGWYRMSFTSQSPASLAGALYVFRMADDTNAFTYTGNGLSGSYFWGIQIEQNSYMTPYLATSGSIGYRDTLFDLSGNNNRGILINGPTYSSTNNGNIVFNGSNQFASVPYSSNFNATTNGITLNTWVYNNNPSGGWRAVITRNRPFANNSVYGIWRNTTDGWHFRLGDGTAGSIINISNAAIRSWTNLTLTYDKTTLTAYINGLNVGTSTPSGHTNNTGNLIIGDAEVNEFFSGSISTVQIYNRALSSTEVLQNYNAQKSRFNLI